MKTFCLTIILALLSLGAQAKPVKNLVELKLHSKKIAMRMDAVAILQEHSFQIVALDDFGGQPFELQFINDEMLFFKGGATYELKKGSKSLLNMPLAQGDFVQIIHHIRPTQFKEVSKTSWVSTKDSKLRVEFSPQSFKVGGKDWPRSFRIEYKNNSFEWQWKP